MNEKSLFGDQDNSYEAAGGQAGLRQLSEAFYSYMNSLPQAKGIRAMHGESLEVLTDKLALFLCGWLGGPRKFQEKYGPIHIPRVHSHLKIGTQEKEAWLLCMKHAISDQNYSDEFKEYLLTQLRVPAERIQVVCNM